MSLIVNDSGNNYESLPEGTYQAVCIGIFDIGLQERKWNNEIKMEHQIVVLWEVDKRFEKGDYAGKRFLVSKRYNKTLGEKSNLRKDLTSWRSKAFTEDELKGFDLEKIIGVNCFVSIIKKGKYTNVGVITKLPDNITPIQKETEIIPEWVTKLQEKGNSNYNKNNIEGTFEGEIVDDDMSQIPF